MLGDSSRIENGVASAFELPQGSCGKSSPVFEAKSFLKSPTISWRSFTFRSVSSLIRACSFWLENMFEFVLFNAADYVSVHGR